mmetsp:Transcript_4512/g.8167  ORF Transcript_4512/g.8167 Transcript_4512/m.8167 type:complete len:283 (+) Transcript_4512:615-1463(+)
MVSDTRHHTWDVRKELIHTVLVPCKSDNKIILLGLHDIEKNFDRLLTVITIISCVVEVVGFINQQQTTHSLLDHFLGLGSGVTNVLTDKIVTSCKNNVSLAGVTHLGKDLSHANRNSSLTGSWCTSETHVKRRNSSLEPKLTTHLIKNQQSGDLLHASFDRNETDKFLIELIKLILNTFLEHEFINSSGRSILRHVPHVGNLLETLLAGDFGGAFTTLGLFLFLTTFGICLVQTFTETNGLEVGIVLVSSIVDGLCSKGILVGIAVQLGGSGHTRTWHERRG